MLRTAELLADLTLLKTLPTTSALALVDAAFAPTPANTDVDFTRATEFLALRAEQIKPDELLAKRQAVAAVLARVVDGVVVVEDPIKVTGGGVRMAGSWGRGV